MSTSVALPYQIVTDRITALLETGVCPWVKPWNAEAGMPRNLFSQREYRGINVWMLGAQSYASPFWATYRQVEQAGGQVRKGEKSTPIVFWKVGIGEDEETGKVRRTFLLRHYSVFNASQVDGIAIPQLPEDVTYEHTPLEQCEKVVTNYPLRPTITHGDSRAFYRPSTDSVHMPDMRDFSQLSSYYSTLFHELTHSTGHVDRLNRPTLVDAVAFGTVRYAKEELIAEMSAAYLCGVTGIVNETVNNSAAYLAGWLKVLKDDPKMLVQAAGAAQKAADHILGTHLDVQGE
jgi:antirestriction protein ArdC